MRILFDDVQELFQRGRRREGLIGLPFPIGPHPTQFSEFLAFHIGRLGDRALDLLGWIIPCWPYLKNLKTLAGHSKGYIQLAAYIARRESAGHILLDKLDDPFNFDFTDGHDYLERT